MWVPSDEFHDAMTLDSTTITEPADAATLHDDASEPRPSVRRRLPRVPARDRVLIGAGVVGAMALGALGSTLFSGSPAPDRADPVEVTESVPSQPKPRLTAREYLGLGEGALKEGRLMEARGHLERGLAARPEDARLRAELCDRMADVSDRLGRADVAALYREQSAALMSGLDDAALASFALAEADLAAGDPRAARRKLHLLALGGSAGERPDPRVRAEAERRLARAYEAEYAASRTTPLNQIQSVTVFSEGGR